MPEWFDSWLVDARTQNLIGLAGVIATVLLGAAAIWAPVRRAIEETFLLTSALLVNLVLLGAAVLLCVAAVALLLLPAPFLALKLSVSAALLLWALRRPDGAPRSAEARMVALIAALSWAVLAVGLSRPAPSAMHRPAAPAAVPTPLLVVPTAPPPAPTLGGTLQGADGAALPTVTPGP